MYPDRASRCPEAPASRRSPTPTCLTGVAVLLLLGVLPGRAQEPSEADTSAADTVVGAVQADTLQVTVGRTEQRLRDAPFAVSRLDARRARLGERAVSLEESLQSVPGVLVARRHNFSLGDRLVIRGAGARSQFGVRGAEVLMDGIPLSLPDGQATLSNLDLGSATTIEVLRGPASALHGNAAGGVVSVSSGGFVDGGPAVRPKLQLGSHGYRRMEIQAAGRAAGFDLLAHADRLETDGFREHSAAETYRANVVARRSLEGGGELRAVVNLFDMPFGENPSSLSREAAREDPSSARSFIVSQGAGEEATQGQAGVTLTLPLSASTRVRATGWGLGRELRNPIPDRIIDLQRGAGGTRLELRGGTAAGSVPLRWTAGLDAELQRDDRLESENLGVSEVGGETRTGELLLDQREEVAFLAPFLRVDARPAEPLQVSAALRWDLFRFDVDDRRIDDGDDSDTRHMEAVSPTFGLTVDPGGSLAFYANVATAFETPTTSELSNRPDGSGGFHPDLDPQRTLGLEAGLRGSSGSGALSWEAAVYRARVTDALVPFEGPGGSVFFRNAGEVLRRGAEARALWRSGVGLDARAAYTLQASRFETFVVDEEDLSGNRVPGVPEHRLFASLSWSTSAGVRAEARWTWTDAYRVDDANTAVNPSSRVVDFRLRWRTRLGTWQVRPFVGVDNVLDERYNSSVVPNAFGDRYYEPAPGRTFFLGAELASPGG
ncbi:MAG: TonB-dependent receptor family protein [Gemmatimonadota bacterium]